MGSLVFKLSQNRIKGLNFIGFWIFRKIDVKLSHQLYGMFQIELQFCIRMEVLQMFNSVKSQMDSTYQKFCFIRKPKFINVILGYSNPDRFSNSRYLCHYFFGFF